jgi:hypothetical protein
MFGESHEATPGFVGIFAVGRLDSTAQCRVPPSINLALWRGTSNIGRRKTPAFSPIFRTSETKLQKGC